MNNKVKIEDLGLIDYKKAWDYQEILLKELVDYKLQGNKKENIGSHYLLLCQHPHVYTLGKNGVENNLLIQDEFLRKIQATYYKINRGGDITYHGPGQLVVYPIFDLERLGIGLKLYIERLEQSVINVLDGINIKAGRFPGATGVWLDPENSEKTRKICAIGVRVSRSVTMHGLAFNINTDLSYYNYINPCGFTDKGVSSIWRETGIKQDFHIFCEKLQHEIIRIFMLEMEELSENDKSI